MYSLAQVMDPLYEEPGDIHPSQAPEARVNFEDNQLETPQKTCHMLQEHLLS